MQSHYLGGSRRLRGEDQQGLHGTEADSNYSAVAGEEPFDFRRSPDDKSNMAKYLFGGFQRCLYPVQKFDSDAERKLAVILERDVLKWFKPAKGSRNNNWARFYARGATM
jgi:hypothetical protein